LSILLHQKMLFEPMCVPPPPLLLLTFSSHKERPQGAGERGQLLLLLLLARLSFPVAFHVPAGAGRCFGGSSSSSSSSCWSPWRLLQHRGGFAWLPALLPPPLQVLQLQFLLPILLWLLKQQKKPLLRLAHHK
jgi:hypothetical protein